MTTYRCSRCGREFDISEAVRRSYFCCNTQMDRLGAPPQPTGVQVCEGMTEARVAVGRVIRPPATWHSPEPFEAGTSAGTVAVEVVPPADNPVDALAMEGLLGSLALEIPFSLEIAATSSGRRFIVRAADTVIDHLCSQLENVYAQVQYRRLSPEDDPAQLLQRECLLGEYERTATRRTAMGQLQLRRLEALPLRTFRDGDFAEADPIMAVLGGFGRVGDGEVLLSQLVLSPAPDDWADGFQDLTRPPDMRIKTESPLGMGGGLLLAAGAGLSLAVGLQFLIWALTGKWLLLSLGILGLAPVVYLVYRAYRHFGRDRLHANPDLISRKIFLPAFRFGLRVAVRAPDYEHARRRLQQVAAVYRHFNAGAGNALTFVEAPFDPCSLTTGRSGLRVPGAPRNILSVAEAASMWHLPWGGGAQLVDKELTLRLLPLPDQVAEGVHIGSSSHHGKTVEVHVPASAMDRNKLLVAKTRRGKTTLMLHFARAACRLPASHRAVQKQGVGNGWRPPSKRAVAFIDPHGDAVQRLMGSMPPERVDSVQYLDMGNDIRIPGWNLLDTRMGFPPELIVESFVYAGQRIWSDFWGPRMEDVLRHVLWTLVRANQQRERYEQFTVLDVQAALILEQFQRSVRRYITDDPELMIWWNGYFDALHTRQRLEVINPVLTKIQRFASSPTVRRIVSQPVSTVDFLGLIGSGGVLLVNLPAGSIGQDNTGFLGSLLLTYLEQAIRTMQDLPPVERPRISVTVDECASIPFTYQRLLAELVKMGADFTLGTQSLAQLDAIERGLLDTTLVNIDTLAVFQTSGRDARHLCLELGEPRLESHHIVNLPEHTCYLRTQRDGRPLPVMSVDVADAEVGTPDTTQRILRNAHRYTEDAAAVEQAYRNYVRETYRMDLEAYTAKVKGWAKLAERAAAEKKVADQKAAGQRELDELRAETDGRDEGPQIPMFRSPERLPENMEERAGRRRGRWYED